TVSYDPALQGVLSGAGTSTLTVYGRTITVDTRPLSIPTLVLDGPVLAKNTALTTFTGLPGTYSLRDSRGSSALVPFTLAANGTISYAPSLQGILTGAGTTTLTVHGRSITIDTRSLSVPNVRLDNVLTVKNTAPFSFTG